MCDSPTPNRTTTNQTPGSHEKSIIYPMTVRQSMSGSKNDFAYGNITKNYQHALNNSAFQKIGCSNASTTLDESRVAKRAIKNKKKMEAVSQSLQNSTRRKSQINIDMNKIKKPKQTKKENSTERNTEQKKKEKYSGKMKNLIQKIIMGKTDLNTLTEMSSSSKSQANSNASATFKGAEDTKDDKQTTMKSRYSKIDEEASDIHSGSICLSESTDHGNQTKEQENNTITREIDFSNNSTFKENIKSYKDKNQEAIKPLSSHNRREKDIGFNVRSTI